MALALAIGQVIQTLVFDWLRLAATRFYSERARVENPELRATLDAAFAILIAALSHDGGRLPRVGHHGSVAAQSRRPRGRGCRGQRPLRLPYGHGPGAFPRRRLCPDHHGQERAFAADDRRWRLVVRVGRDGLVGRVPVDDRFADRLAPLTHRCRRFARGWRAAGSRARRCATPSRSSWPICSIRSSRSSTAPSSPSATASPNQASSPSPTISGSGSCWPWDRRSTSSSSRSRSGPTKHTAPITPAVRSAATWGS